MGALAPRYGGRMDFLVPKKYQLLGIGAHDQ